MPFQRCLPILTTVFATLAFLSIAGSACADDTPTATAVVQTTQKVPGGGVIAHNAIVSRTRLNPAQILHLSFELPSPNAADLELTVQAQYTPGSPKFHQWLTPKQFGERFGASDDDLQAVENWAAANGMTVTKVWDNHLFLSVDTTVAQAEQSMNIHLAHFAYRPNYPGAKIVDVFAPSDEPSLPSAIASKICFVGGLTDAIRPVKSVISITPTSLKANVVEGRSTPLTVPLEPSSLARIYDIDRLQPQAGSSTGYRIGIYSPTLYHQSDIDTYLSEYSLTAPSPIETWPGAPTDSSKRAADYTGSDEAALDIETILGLAQGAQVTLYEANGSGNVTTDQFNQMAQDNLPVISSSWVFSEDANFIQGYDELETILQQMSAQGQAFFASSGDMGAYGNGGTTLNVGFPASSAFATGVGGTTLPYSDNGYWDYETAWSGSGGGVSQFFARPSWQTGPNVINSDSNGMRQIPDVASIADLPGVRIFANGAWVIDGGTSLGPPTWAAGAMLLSSALSQRFGNMAPQLYQFANDPNTYHGIFHDIDMGSNQVYNAGPGYDFVTGLGSVDFYELFLYLSPTPPIETVPHGLEMVSVPYEFGSTPLGSIFDMASPVAQYNATSGAYDVSSTDPSLTIHAGNGYWIRAHDPLNIFTAGTPTPVGNFTYTPKVGWNMLGDPFAIGINLQHAIFVGSDGTHYSFAGAAKAGLVAPGLYSYNYELGRYELTSPTGTLEPYVGYWIDVYEPCTILFPSTG